MKFKINMYEVEFDDEIRRKGGPYFSAKEKREAATGYILANKSHIAEQSGEFQLTRDQFMCANEVYPESALTDPIADLEMYDEWRGGKRTFPYPGMFSRLDLNAQQQKVSSTTSTGVIGEIITGLICQEVLAPTVIVRPIRRFPDFILQSPPRGVTTLPFIYAEAKATLSCEPHIRTDHFQKSMEEVLLQINSDPWIQLAYSYTSITQIEDFSAETNIYLMKSTDDARTMEMRLPQAIWDALMDRAFGNTLEYHHDEIVKSFKIPDVDDGLLYSSMESPLKSERPRTGRPKKEIAARQVKLKDTIVKEVPGEFESLLRKTIKSYPNYDISRVMDIENSALEAAVETRMNKFKPTLTAGPRMRKVKQLPPGHLGALRTTGAGDLLLMADLTEDELDRLESEWTPDITKINKPMKTKDGRNYWRCSSTAVVQGSKHLEGQML